MSLKIMPRDFDGYDSASGHVGAREIPRFGGLMDSEV